jgi:hypothetical protein
MAASTPELLHQLVQVLETSSLSSFCILGSEDGHILHVSEQLLGMTGFKGTRSSGLVFLLEWGVRNLQLRTPPFRFHADGELLGQSLKAFQGARTDYLERKRIGASAM